MTKAKLTKGAIDTAGDRAYLYKDLKVEKHHWDTLRGQEWAVYKPGQTHPIAYYATLVDVREDIERLHARVNKTTRALI